MPIRSVLPLTAVAAVLFVTSEVSAFCCGARTALARRGGCGIHRGCAESSCGQSTDCCYQTITLTRTIFEPVCEQQQRVEYDTVWDQQTVHDVQRVSRIRYRNEEFSYQRTYYETQSKEVPYTVTWPIYETRSRDVSYVTYAPAYETRVRSIPYTTYHPVCETHYRTISYSVPRQVTYTQRIQVCTGHWETREVKCPSTSAQKSAQKGECVTCQRVWVPRIEEREVTCCRTEYDVCQRQVPYTVTRMVPETHTREYQYTEVRMMPVTQVRTVQYQVVRTMSEQRFRTVNYTVQRSVPETGIRCVPYTEHEEIPITRTVSVPRQVPRTVCYTVTRMVPRVVTCEVRVPVCCPEGKEKGKATSGDKDLNGELQAPDLAPSAPTPDASASRPAELILTAVTTEEPADSQDHRRHFVSGLEHYRNGDFEQAITAWRAAAQGAPKHARYAYFLALALHQMGKVEEADRTLAHAVRLERENPDAGLGKALERIQGEPRLWLEAARQKRGASE